MAHLAALVERAGGAAAFNVLAAEVLAQPIPSQPAIEIDDLDARDSLDRAIEQARDGFISAAPDDDSEIAVTLALRPYGGVRIARVDGGGRLWWRRQDAAPGWVDCPLSDIFDVHIEWRRRFHVLYCRIHGRSTAPMTLSPAGRAMVAARQAFFEQQHEARLREEQQERERLGRELLHHLQRQQRLADENSIGNDDTIISSDTLSDVSDSEDENN